MKKVLTIIVLLLVICGCKKDKAIVDYTYDNIGIVTPTGAPALAFLNYLYDKTFETNSVPKNIISMMNESSDKRIVVIDTVTGIDAIVKKSVPYKLAANITFGNYYIAATGNDDNRIMDKDDNIVLFGEGMTPDFLFKFIYDDINFTNVEYVDAVSDAGKCLAMGKNVVSDTIVDYVFIAEPVLTNILNNKEVPTYGNSYVYADVQELYKGKTGKNIVQASVFIKNDNYIKDFDDFSNFLSSNINSLLTNEKYVGELLKAKSETEISSIFGIAPEQIKKMLKTNAINLGYVKAIDNIEEINSYLKTIGKEEINEEICFKTN